VTVIPNQASAQASGTSTHFYEQLKHYRRQQIALARKQWRKSIQTEPYRCRQGLNSVVNQSSRRMTSCPWLRRRVWFAQLRKQFALQSATYWTRATRKSAPGSSQVFAQLAARTARSLACHVALAKYCSHSWFMFLILNERQLSLRQHSIEWKVCALFRYKTERESMTSGKMLARPDEARYALMRWFWHIMKRRSILQSELCTPSDRQRRQEERRNDRGHGTGGRKK